MYCFTNTPGMLIPSSVKAITKMSNITEMCNIRAIRVVFLGIILLKAVNSSNSRKLVLTIANECN